MAVKMILNIGFRNINFKLKNKTEPLVKITGRINTINCKIVTLKINYSAPDCKIIYFADENGLAFLIFEIMQIAVL